MQGRGPTGAAVAVRGVDHGGGAGGADSGRRGADRQRRYHAGDARSADPLSVLGPARGARARDPRRPAGAALSRRLASSRSATSPAVADGAWQQSFDIVGIKARGPQDLELQGRRLRASISSGGTTTSPRAACRSRAPRSQNAELVFVGYGIQAPEYQWDDFKGMDLKGKVLVMLNNDPGLGPEALRRQAPPLLRPLDLQVRERRAPGSGRRDHHPHHALGRLPVAGGADLLGRRAVRAARRRRAARPGEGLGHRGRRATPAQGGAARIWTSWSRRRTRATSSRCRSASRTSLTFANKLSKVQTANVAGRAARQRSEARRRGGGAIGAPRSPRHRRAGRDGDRIYNGAVDNASGCAQVLAIARAFAALPQRPRRSIIALFVAGEEQGLLGSQYYARASDRARRPDRGEHQLRRRQHLRPHPRCDTDQPRQVLARHDRRAAWPSLRVACSSPTSSPTAATTTAPTSSRSPRSACRRSTSRSGTDFIGRPAGWGKQQIEEWELKQYHQPSDQLDGTWNFDGMIEDAQLDMLSALAGGAGRRHAHLESRRRVRGGTQARARRRRALGVTPCSNASKPSPPIRSSA